MKKFVSRISAVFLGISAAVSVPVLMTAEITEPEYIYTLLYIYVSSSSTVSIRSIL